ncbi:acyl-CoA dehydrogenase family protein [Nocardia transvalensis]|uniref:acyl-CoA dehydrogenase family protein n=1 Tax=Nocardia transvalensis TaxID=37333 RepID=UPI001893AEA4|nr:acyl-CoA dehydrogenase family protein [Nocardia transvalensis]MBF6333635.1 hypothetical protein [Nocardia transvalensis]
MVLDWIAKAEKIAADTLTPGAAEVDRTGVIPETNFEALAGNGFYGIPFTGEIGAEELLETLALIISGCLATGFVWAQHIGALQSVSSSDNSELRDALMPRMVTGERRCCITHAGANSMPSLVLSETSSGYTLAGTSPFVTGWDYTDTLVASSLLRRDGIDHIAALVVPDKLDTRIRATELSLIAATASSTVRLDFDDLPIPADSILSIVPRTEFMRTRVVRNEWVNGALVIGVLKGCIGELEDQGGDADVFRTRYAELLGQYAAARGDVHAVRMLRAEISRLAVNAAAAAMVATGVRSVVAHSPAERWVRQAAFGLLVATHDPLRQLLLQTFTRSADPDTPIWPPNSSQR